VNNNNTFTGKVALATRGTSGIGKAPAIGFARAGAKVVVSDRREQEGAEVVRHVQKPLPCSTSLPMPRNLPPAHRYVADGGIIAK